MLKSFWKKTFLEERSTFGLGVFRLFAAFTTGAHVFPTLLRMEDNYLHTAFKEKNFSFFPLFVLQWVEKSPDTLVWAWAALFCIAVVLFGVGLFTQISAIVMTLGCYYFYALNSLHIGTLSYDILLVTLVLVCVTDYPGQTLSLDSRLKYGRWLSGQTRPVFLQRLLELQLVSTFFYTALSKVTGHGNWLTGNPIYHLLNTTPESVVKAFPLREFFAAKPDLCYAIGLLILLFEFTMPFFIYWKKTRWATVMAGWLFHVMLLVTLHVPTIFFFLFPAQLALFILPVRKTRQR